MRLEFCAQEREVAAALREGRWPGAVDPAIRAHVESCRSCGEFVLVTQSLRQFREEASRTAVLPAPGALWWRAQVRRRQGAFERITRPIAVAEKIALVAAVAGLLCLAAWQWSSISDWALRLASATRPGAILDTVWLPLSNSGGWILALLIAGVGTLALFGGLAFYFLTEKD
jgi:hypothetical protein